MTKKVLRLTDFTELSLNQQFDILHADGVYVGKRKIKGQTVVLLQLYSFYVEVFYKVYRKEIDYILSSDNTDLLQPYINQVHVRDLNKDEDPGK